MATENKKTETKKTEEKKPAVVVPNFFQKVKIGKEFKHGNVTLREYATLKENDLEGATILVGFPDSGLTASIVSHYIIKKLNLPVIGDFSSKLFPPLLTVKHGQPATGARIYGNKLLVVIVSEYKIEVPELQHELIEAIVAFTKRNKCKLVLTVDSVSDDPTEEHELLDSLEVENVLGEDGEGGDDEYGGEEGGFDEEYEAMEVPAATLSGGALPTGAPAAVKIPSKLVAKAAITKSSKSKAKKEIVEDEEEEKPKKKSSKKGSKKAAEEEDEEDEEDISKYDEKIYFLTSNQKVGETLASQKSMPIVEYASKSISAGLVLQVTFDEDVDCCVLLAPMDKLGVGTRGAIAILKCLNCLFKGEEGAPQAIAVDTEELNNAAQGLEKKVKELMAKVQQPKDDKHILDRIYM